MKKVCTLLAELRFGHQDLVTMGSFQPTKTSNKGILQGERVWAKQRALQDIELAEKFFKFHTESVREHLKFACVTKEIQGMFWVFMSALPQANIYEFLTLFIHATPILETGHSLRHRFFHRLLSEPVFGIISRSSVDLSILTALKTMQEAHERGGKIKNYFEYTLAEVQSLTILREQAAVDKNIEEYISALITFSDKGMKEGCPLLSRHVGYIAHQFLDVLLEGKK